MKKVKITLLAGIIAISASANINGDGYYRVQNCKTERYIYVLDNKGKLNFQATTAELGAIELWKNYDKTITDPATVIYVTDLTGKKQDYDLQAQGTGVNEIISHPVSIRQDSKYFPNSYMVFGRDSGVTRYIGDGTRMASDQGYVASLDNNEYYRWYFHPITTDDSNYFGIKGELTVDNSTYYTSFFAAFPFTFHSAGMKAYEVYHIQDGKAHIREITNGVAAATPVIITTSSPYPSDNRLNIGAQTGAKPGTNLLEGVYFNNQVSLHVNLTPYDPKTMRVLGKLSDGTIGFKTENIQYLPRNKAYLVVPEGTPSELAITTQAPSGVEELYDSTANIQVDGLNLYVSGVNNAKVYSVSGTLVGELTNAENGKSMTLPAAGIYIVKAGDKVTKVSAK